MEQELGGNVTLQEIEVVSTQNITKVKCPMIFKRFFFFIKKKKRKKKKIYLFCDAFGWLSNYLSFCYFGRNVIEWLYIYRRIRSKFKLKEMNQKIPLKMWMKCFIMLKFIKDTSESSMRCMALIINFLYIYFWEIITK